MQLGLKILIVLVAFAGNSILNRLAVGEAFIDENSFLFFRILSGALTLYVIVVSLGQPFHWRASIGSSIALFFYAWMFSLAYVRLDAGVGALLLFGIVQLTMFSGSIYFRETITKWRWLGMFLGLLGLVLLTGATFHHENGLAIFYMILSGVAWGFFSLLGRGKGSGVSHVATGFILATPMALIVFLIQGADRFISGYGLFLAVLSGSITSGLGYALWYRVLPSIEASLAAVLQLAVPLIAAFMGVIFLAESVTLNFISSAVLVLGGIALATLMPHRFKS